MKRNRTLLKPLIAAATLGAAFASPAALADPIDFESTLLTSLNGNESTSAGGFRFTAADGPVAQFFGFTGVAGAVYNGGQGCGDTPCPAGNTSNFYTGLNDGSVTLTHEGGRFFGLGSLDFGFLAAVPGLPDGTWGQLRLSGSLVGGGVLERALDFAGQNVNGEFMFSNWLLDAGFASSALNSLTISACMYDGSGACVNSVDAPALNLAQFAIDNLAVSVPEPAAPALLMLGALGMALTARRRAK